MRFKILTTSSAVLAIMTGHSDAFWRMSCSIIQTSRIDPVTDPGHIADHVHKISGASNISPNSTHASLQTSSCTSCEVQADKSAYWTPLLYYQHPNTTLQEVPANGMTVYYLGRGSNRTNLQPFPPGLRMLSGDQNARTFDNLTLTAPLQKGGRHVPERVSFACLDALPQKETPHLAQTNCANGLRAQVHFQSCWDGVNLYREDQSHVAYLSGIDNGDCPPTHPVPFIHLFYEVLYSVNDVRPPNAPKGGRFVFSHGDTTGFAFHGDFMNGWDIDVLTEAVKGCANTEDGDVGGCEAFQSSHVKDTERFCPEQRAMVNEPVRGLISKLPGGHRVEDVPGFVGKAVPSGSVDGALMGPTSVTTETMVATTMVTSTASALAARSHTVANFNSIGTASTTY